MKILGIAGSLRENSYTNKVLRLAMEKIHNVEVEMICLKDLNLPFCDGSKKYPNFPDVERFRSMVKQANGIIIASPEYHGSVSGPMKNALDLLEVTHTQGKIFALIAVCGGVTNTGALNALRLICRWLYAFVIPEQIVVGEPYKAFDKYGNLSDADLDEKLQAMVNRLLLFSDRLENIYL